MLLTENFNLQWRIIVSWWVFTAICSEMRVLIAIYCIEIEYPNNRVICFYVRQDKKQFFLKSHSNFQQVVGVKRLCKKCYVGHVFPLRLTPMYDPIVYVDLWIRSQNPMYGMVTFICIFRMFERMFWIRYYLQLGEYNNIMLIIVTCIDSLLGN